MDQRLAGFLTADEAVVHGKIRSIMMMIDIIRHRHIFRQQSLNIDILKFRFLHEFNMISLNRISCLTHRWAQIVGPYH